MSKAVARLERRLGERLFHRTSRRLALTETGRALSVRAAQILADAEAVEAEALAQSPTPRGRVRMAAPMSFGIEHVAPALPEFFRTYPEISLDLHLSDQTVDLVGGGFDLALRIAALSDSSMVARRLCQVRRLLVGAPAYFAAHGRPSHPRELARHACLGYTYLPSGDNWQFTGPSGEAHAVIVSGPLHANNADGLMADTSGGFGTGGSAGVCYLARPSGRSSGSCHDRLVGIPDRGKYRDAVGGTQTTETHGSHRVSRKPFLRAHGTMG